MIQLMLEICLGLLFVQCSIVKSTDMNPSREQLFLPALRGLVKDVPEQDESWKRNFDEDSFDHIQESSDVTKRMLNEMLSRRENMNHLERILKDVFSKNALPDSTIRDIRSSACKFGLGGHCATEEMDQIADSYHWLHSPSSPGRKRRFADV